MKRFVSVALSLSLVAGLLSGCGGNKEPKGDVAMGRYIEEKGAVLEDVTRLFSVRRDGDGNIIFYTGNDEQTVTRNLLPADGGELRQEEVAGLVEAAGELRISNLSEGADGTLLVLCSEFSSNRYKMLKAVGEGNFKAVEVAGWDTPIAEAPNVTFGFDSIGGASAAAAGGSVSVSGGVMADAGEGQTAAADGVEATGSGSYTFSSEGEVKTPYGMTALPGGGFLVYYGLQGAAQYDAEGALVREYPGEIYGSQTAVWENKFLTNSGDNGEFAIFDLENGKQTGTASYGNSDYFVKMGMDEQGLYLGDASGIYRQKENGSVWEKLVDGSLTTLAMPTISLAGLVSDGNGGFVGLLQSDGQIQVARYLYSAETPTTPDTELTIFSLHDNNTIRQAIGEFQRQNPNVRVNFQIMMDEDSGATAQDLINSLNTELLSGKGPDLLLLDGLPVESYINKGVLADITELVDGHTDLYKNLMSAYERDGKIYGVPTRFSFPVMAGAGADLDQFTSLEAMVKLVREQQGDEVPLLVPPTNLWDQESAGMMMNYYGLCAGSWLSADKTIDQLALAQYLTEIKDLDGILKEHSPQMGGAFTTIAISSTGSNIIETMDMGFWSLGKGEGRVYVSEMGGMMSLANLMHGTDLELRSAFNSNKYTPKGGIGIVSTGEQQELAGSFLDMVLSGTVQDAYLADGLPVNQASLSKLVEESMKDNDFSSDLGFLALCGELTTPILTDEVIQDALETQLRGLVEGSTTPEDAAAAVVDKTQIYLSE